MCPCDFVFFKSKNWWYTELSRISPEMCYILSNSTGIKIKLPVTIHYKRNTLYEPCHSHWGKDCLMVFLLEWIYYMRYVQIINMTRLCGEISKFLLHLKQYSCENSTLEEISAMFNLSTMCISWKEFLLLWSCFNFR